MDQVRSMKFSGVFNNENLTWSDYISTAIKTNKNLGVIRKLNNILPSDVLHMLTH